MNIRNTLVLASVATAIAVAPSARAQANKPDEAKIAEAKQRMVEGKRLYADRKYEEAWLKFVQACAVLKSEKCITGLAVTEYAAGRTVDAYDHLRGLLDPTPKASLTTAQVQDLTKTMSEAYAKTGHLRVKAPQGAVVLVDGQQVGIAPVEDTVTVTPGPHRLEAKLPDHSLNGSTEAVAAEVVDVTLAEPEAVTTPVLTSAPAATVNNATPSIHDQPIQQRTGSWVSSPAVPIVLGVVAVGLAVGGIVSLANANSDSDRASSLRAQSGIGSSSCANSASPSCAELSSVIDSKDANRTREVVFFTGAGVAALGVAAWFIWGRETNHDLAVTPLVGPGIAGGSLSARF